jgi:hypothetical protein
MPVQTGIQKGLIPDLSLPDGFPLHCGESLH